jgi:hypothetical protein
MLQFLVPLGGLGLVTLLLPLALHLWRPPLQTVRLGSLRFLNTQTRPPRQALRLRKWLILALRLFLLALLAGVLAWPRWRSSAVPRTSWALLAPGAELAGPALVEWRQTLAEGAEGRWLAPGFPMTGKIPQPERSGKLESEPPGVWSLLREADARLPAGSKLTVFASSGVAVLRGDRPGLAHASVRWIETAPIQKTSDWIGSPTFSRDGKEISGWVGNSRATTTLRRRFVVPATPGSHEFAGMTLEVSANAKEIRLVGRAAGPWLPVGEEQPMRVILWHGSDRDEDARYVAAGIGAVASATGRPLVLEENPAAERLLAPGIAWIFQLGAKPLPAEARSAIEAQGAELFSDLADEKDAHAIDSEISVLANADGVSGLVGPVRIWRMGNAAIAPGSPVWTDGPGNPLLTISPLGRGRHWQFQSRINPAWTDWPLGTGFPAWLRARLLGDEAMAGDRDLRIADPSQAAPAFSPSAPSAVIPREFDLRLLAALLAAFIFLLERCLSLRRGAASGSAPISP